ncbi:MAG: 4-vinyl reductase [Gemmatimonadota bacterium]|nr:4-vinyl reductase [Gemmatimonadota bacterium]
MNDAAASTLLVSFPGTILPALASALGTRMDAAEAAQLLREMGSALGEPLHRLLEVQVDERFPGTRPEQLAEDEFWAAFSELFQQMGWGDLTRERLHPGVAALSSSHWFEAAPDAGGSFPACHLSTGALAELLRRVAGEQTAVLEVECRSRGDGRCRFLVGGEQTLSPLFGAMQDGTPYRQAIESLG